MTGTVLRVYEDGNGRLYFRTDIPSGMSEMEKCCLIGQIQLAMMTDLRGPLEMAVNACIRQLALGSVMCSNDLEATKADFRAEVDRFLPPIREANRKMVQSGELKVQTEGS